MATVAGVALFWAFRRPEARDPVLPRTVEPFSLKDQAGRTHAPSDWRDSRAVVVALVGGDGPAAQSLRSEVGRLARDYEKRGVSVYGIVPSATVAAGGRDWPFPVLLDPAQELIGGLGFTVESEAAVLDPRGHILYRGQDHLEAALVAALRGRETPSTTQEPPTGRALPAPAPLFGEEAITYSKHVAPILQQHCADCHRPGEVGPFSLLSYADAAKRAKFLVDVTSSRQMPPWGPVHGYGDFHDEGRLSPRELAVLARWAETGAPEGNPADKPASPPFPEGWQLGKPDLVVTMPEAFKIPAGGLDYYRAFVVPLPKDRDVSVAAVEFRPGNRKAVHHARFYLDATDESRRRDAADPEPGFSSVGGGDIIKPGLGAWTPGVVPRMPPADVGKVVRKGSDLVMLVHYHGTGKDESDRSSLGLFFNKRPARRSITHISLNSNKIDIPPGESRHRMTLTTFMAADAHAVSVLPHGHFLMREISLTATLPDGRVVPMLWVNDWDFNWQGQYHFARPVALPKGTRLDVVAYYDNSAANPSNPHSPPRRVKFGLGSADEMLGCHVQVIADDAESQKVFDRTLPFGL